MNESQRTLVYVGVAAVSVGLAFALRYTSEPPPLEEFANIGEPFYPDFENPNEAKSLRVVAFNEETASIREFGVEFKDGLWRIPSHHDYPADAEDRLSDTAASVIGIERGTLVGRRDSDHERFGVIDPLDEDVTALKGRGQRVTLAKENGEILADYIIGKRSESATPGSNEEDTYYVRRPKEKETYRSRLKIDLSTKFSDWIESDLLKVQREDLREIVINKYSIDEAQRRIVDREVNRLTREKSMDPWKLDGLDEETEEVQTSETSTMVSSLDDLKIVGVRPKPPGLGADLKVDQSVIQSQLQLDVLVNNMADKGFLVIPGEDGKPQLVSNEGELVAATDQGVVYTLRFGEIFTGSEFEIEVGSTDDEAGEETSEESSADDAADAESETAGTDGDAAGGDSPKSDLKRSRYLFVSAQFDPKYVGEAPTKPQEPVKPPEGSADADGEGAETTDDEEAGGEEAGDSGDGGSDSENETDSDSSTDDADAEETDPQAIYEAAQKKYEQDLKTYESDLKAYNEKLEEGRKKAEELNDRFAGWFYVISADSFEKLRLSRSELVKAKEPEEDESDSSNDPPADSASETSDAPTDTEAATEPEEPAAPAEPEASDPTPSEGDPSPEPDPAEQPKAESTEEASDSAAPDDSGSAEDPEP